MLEWILPAVLLFGAAAEAFVEPRPKMLRHPGRLIVSGCVTALLMLIILVLTARPVFSALTASLLVLLMVVVSNVKFAVLHEPLVFVDFAMLGQIAKHPRLFLPYLGLTPAIIIVGSIALGIGAALQLEAPIQFLAGEWALWRLAGAAGIGLAAILGYRLLRDRLVRWGRRLNPSFDPQTDIRRFGLTGTMLLTLLLSTDQAGKDGIRQRKRRALAPAQSNRPSDIVAVQAESFFDVRLMDPRIDRGLLPWFDACAREAVFRGRLEVPAWGAYTQRTEFAFLTGLRQKELGPDRFNPYLRFAKRPVWSIAHDLRALGYRTICIHPYVGTFFGRDRVLPNLGFDLFLDITAFQGASAFGPYISDRSTTEKVIEILERSDRPTFIFAITMENHGQWRPDRLPLEEIARIRRAAPWFPPEFLCYLRHLVNADAMIGQLAGFLEKRGEGTLCLYGDHVPSFPKVFERSNFDDPRSDYLIWRPAHAGPVAQRDIDVAGLSDLLLRAAGIGPATPVDRRSRMEFEDLESRISSAV